MDYIKPPNKWTETTPLTNDDVEYLKGLYKDVERLDKTMLENYGKFALESIRGESNLEDYERTYVALRNVLWGRQRELTELFIEFFPRILPELEGNRNGPVNS